MINFNKIFDKISSTIAFVVMFGTCAAVYLNAKGFSFDANGNIILVQDANAQTESFVQPVEERALIHLSNPHFIGDEKAPITIYEYSSFGCSHCADFHLNTLKKLDEDFIKEGKIRVALVYFPIDKKSMQAAMVASCIPDEEYHNFVNTLFNKQREWSLSAKGTELIAKYASLHGIDTEKAFKCMKDDDIASEILANRQQGIDELSIKGTPSFLIDDGETQEVIPGALDYPLLKAYLSGKLLHKQPQQDE